MSANLLVSQYIDDSSESMEDIDVAYIVNRKPKTVIVREFMKAQLESIVPDDEAEFMMLL